MATLVNVTPKVHSSLTAVQIWGFHDPCTVKDVQAALMTIAHGLSGPQNTIHIMSGSHGFCKGRVGAPASREQKFADEDGKLLAPKTKDNKTVMLKVHDFQNYSAATSGPDPVTTAMAKLNTLIHDIVGTAKGGTHTFLLAYCCSAGTK